jgi:glycerate kinase
MARFLIVCDKFKGSVTASQAMEAIAQGCAMTKYPIDCKGIPVADGGEGSLLSVQAAIGGNKIVCSVLNAAGYPVEAYYLRHGLSAYLETSLSCGLTILPDHLRNPISTSTFGVGMLIRHAIAEGCRDIHLFLGGSGTHDGGAGMAAAMGYGFRDSEGSPFLPTGGTLHRIAQIYRLPWAKSMASFSFSCWADVDVPLTGEQGSIQFARQKGATEVDLLELERGMRHYSLVLQAHFSQRSKEWMPYAGASGGLGAGCEVYLGATTGGGWNFISNLHKIESQIREADLVITGEGKLDSQSMRGKVVAGVADMCRKWKKPCVILCGEADISMTERAQLGNPIILELRKQGDKPGQSMAEAFDRLGILAQKFAQDWLSGKIRRTS